MVNGSKRQEEVSLKEEISSYHMISDEVLQQMIEEDEEQQEENVFLDLYRAKRLAEIKKTSGR